jgi:hypothetical protein
MSIEDKQYWDSILRRYFAHCNDKDVLQKQIKRKKLLPLKNGKMVYKYYILSKINTHVLGVLSETETTITVQKLKVEKIFDLFINDYKDEIVADFSMEQVNDAILPKDDLSFRIEEVEITKDYWVVFEYLTGKKRRAVSNSTES